MTEQRIISVETMAEITEDRINTTIQFELGLLVDEGLLNLGIDPVTGEAIYWPTRLGCEVLGMESEPNALSIET